MSWWVSDDKKDDKSNSKSLWTIEFVIAVCHELIGALFLACPLVFIYFLMTWGTLWLIIPIVLSVIFAYRYWRKKFN